MTISTKPDAEELPLCLTCQSCFKRDRSTRRRSIYGPQYILSSGTDAPARPTT